MIDIHAHILPGADDGSDNLEDSLRMAQMAADSGVTAMIATPHCNLENYFENYYSESLMKQFYKLADEIKRNDIALELLPGMEIYATPDITELFDDGKLLGLNGSRYYLMEFPFEISERQMHDILHRVLERKDVVPVIAHPERYACVQFRPQFLFEEVMAGCLTQVNKGSILGKFGQRAYDTAMTLLEYNLIACIASDAHTPFSRTPYLRDAEKYLEETYSGYCAKQLLEWNPRKIAGNKTLEIRGTARSIEKRFF